MVEISGAEEGEEEDITGAVAETCPYIYAEFFEDGLRLYAFDSLK